MSDGTTAEIADLEAQLADAAAAAVALEPQLAAAERERALADAVYQAALRAHGAALQAAYELTRSLAPLPEGRTEQARQAVRDSEGALQQADTELQAALVRLNSLGRQRGELRMLGRRLEMALEQARRQAVSERQTRDRDPGRALLERIKSSLAG